MTDPSMFMPREPVTLVCEVCKAECDLSDQMPTEAILQQYAGMGDRMICEECAGLAPTEPAPPRVHEGEQKVADVIQFVRPNRRERRTISAKARRNA
jgi:hypothetical protein